MKIDVDEMKDGQAVADRLRRDRTDGIPWMVILDAEGTELISSDGPHGNIGCPMEAEEREYFVTMIEITKKKMSPGRLTAIASALEEYAAKKRRR